MLRQFVWPLFRRGVHQKDVGGVEETSDMSIDSPLDHGQTHSSTTLYWKADTNDVGSTVFITQQRQSCQMAPAMWRVLGQQVPFRGQAILSDLRLEIHQPTLCMQMQVANRFDWVAASRSSHRVVATRKSSARASSSARVGKGTVPASACVSASVCVSVCRSTGPHAARSLDLPAATTIASTPCSLLLLRRVTCSASRAVKHRTQLVFRTFTTTTTATTSVAATAGSRNTTMATFVKPDVQGFAYAGEQLRAGQLIAFPTETVYGLGANALDPDAVLSIFKAKGRPLTDPLIVHVPTIKEAVELVDLTEKGRLAFECLGRAFWPGPLTLIAKAVPALPLTVSAHTGFVGLRCPAHPIAQELLAAAKVPVAAPSANRFGHVSPTTAQHVMDDLGMCGNIGIIEGRDDVAVCKVGIESTVAKIVPEENKLVIFRRGGISDKALAKVLERNVALLGAKYEIVTIQKEVQENTSEAQQAPGQLLTHYAPDVDTYLYQESATEVFDLATDDVSGWVVLDFHGKLRALQHKVKAYNDLSPSGDITEGTQNIFDLLRWAENVVGVQRVVITDVLAEDHELAAALHDRMFRASSGKLRSLRF